MTRSFDPSTGTPVPVLSRTAATAFTLSIVAAGTAVASGMGARWGLWRFTTGFILLRAAVLGSIVSAAVSLSAVVMTSARKKKRGHALSVLGLVVSLVAAGIPLTWYATARRVPRIHDITTDTGDPPRFEAILPLREQAPNAAAYGGPEVAALQHAAYPDVKPLALPVQREQAFDRATAVARSFGWTIVNEDRKGGRIEATDTTFWFGFKDDIVIRVRSEGSGSRIDIRSLSRVGVSDVGTNAARIRKFIAKMTSFG